jgi:NADH-quinone oxidoreductase subunit N
MPAMPGGLSTSDFYYILPELVLTGGALLLLICDVLLPRRSKALGWIALVVIGATMASLAPFTSTHVEVAHGLLAVDRFALFFKIIFLGAAAITVLMSMKYLEIEGVSPGEYYFLILCSTLGMMVMAGGIDLISIFIGLETMAVAFYILVGFIKPNPRSNEAAVKYFLLGAFSLGILLYGMSLMYGLSGTTSLRMMATAFVGQEKDPRLILAVILVVAGVGFKIAAVPFHMWAPDVYEGAPTPVTAFFAIAPKVAAMALFLRLLVEPFGGLTDQWRQVIMFMSVLSMIIGALGAIQQTNIKRLMAYGSIGHVGYLMLGLSAGTQQGVSGILVYLSVYLAMSVGVFAVILCMRHQGRMVEDLAHFAGLSRSHPMLAAVMAVFMFSMAGVPPLAGFFGKMYVFLAAVEAHLYALAVVGVLTSVIGAYYYLRVIKLMYFDETPVELIDRQDDDSITAVLVVASVFTLLFFVVPVPVLNGAAAAAASLFAG